MSKKSVYTLIKNTLFQNNANHHLGLSMSHSGNIKDHWLQIIITNIIIVKKFEILWEVPICDTETQSKQMLLEKRHRHKPSICEKRNICEAQ